MIKFTGPKITGPKIKLKKLKIPFIKTGKRRSKEEIIIHIFINLFIGVVVGSILCIAFICSGIFNLVTNRKDRENLESET